MSNELLMRPYTTSLSIRVHVSINRILECISVYKASSKIHLFMAFQVSTWILERELKRTKKVDYTASSRMKLFQICFHNSSKLSSLSFFICIVLKMICQAINEYLKLDEYLMVIIINVKKYNFLKHCLFNLTNEI